MFSRFSVALKRRSVETPQQLASLLKQAYTPNPTVTFLHKVGEYKQWLTPWLYPLHGHSAAHQLKLRAVDDSDVRMKFKEWARHTVWQPQETTGLCTLHWDLVDTHQVIPEAAFTDFTFDAARRLVKWCAPYWTSPHSEMQWDIWFDLYGDFAVQTLCPTWPRFLRLRAAQPRALAAVAPEPMEIVDSELVRNTATRATIRSDDSSEDESTDDELGMDLEEIVPGMFVVVDVDTDFMFEVAQVRSVHGEEVSIHWWGTDHVDCRGIWKKQYRTGDDNKPRPHTQTVQKDNIIWVTEKMFTRGNKILKSVYKRIVERFRKGESREEE